ncbi:MAG TPA: phosphohistidine phosphatase SixA [Terriglobales bacterium]|nr:phosphohistidine phosphatase SixA [Terriglobales bacterium]
MIIYFLRHASAGTHKPDAKKDEKRALDKEGIEQCGMIGRALAAMNVHVDVVVSSPLKRAAQTAALVSNEMGHEGKLQLDAALKPGGTWEDFNRLLQKYSNAEAIMVVGHNPNLSEFLGRLIGRRAPAHVDLKKGAVAKTEADSKGGTLEWCITPKTVRAAYDSGSAKK